MKKLNYPRIYGLPKKLLSRERESRGVAKLVQSHSRFRLNAFMVVEVNERVNQRISFI